ncbi:hypothetical protein ATCC90586_003025 [Pythium insidiosum]|nr:hypothetical protein ATCC90586_003025 [Pythium insidiosum]
METLVCFVYGSGGVVRMTEVLRFLRANDDVWQALLEAAAPTRAFKRMIVRLGTPYGLRWLDADPSGACRGSVIALEGTPSIDVSGVTLWMPRTLQALQDAVRRHGDPARDADGRLVRTICRQRLLRCFALEFPEEAAFMKRRSDGLGTFLWQYAARADGIVATCTRLVVAELSQDDERPEVPPSSAVARYRRPQRLLQSLQVVYVVFVLQRRVQWPPQLVPRRPLSDWCNAKPRRCRARPRSGQELVREEAPAAADATAVSVLRLLVPTKNGLEWRVTTRRVPSAAAFHLATGAY